MRAAVVDLLLTGEDVLAVHAGKVSHDLLGLLRRLCIAGIGLCCLDRTHACLFQCDIVEIRPAPAALDADGVLAGIQLHIAEFQLAPLRIHREAHLTLVYIIDNDVLDLVTAEVVLVADGQRVHAGCIDCYRDVDHVAVVLEVHVAVAGKTRNIGLNAAGTGQCAGLGFDLHGSSGCRERHREHGIGC